MITDTGKDCVTLGGGADGSVRSYFPKSTFLRLACFSSWGLVRQRRPGLDSRRERRFPGGKGFCRTQVRVRDCGFAGGKDRAEQADLEQSGGKEIERGCVAALGALHGDAEAQRGLRHAVLEQDYAGDDLHGGTRDAVEDPLDVMNEDDGVLEGVQFVG